MPTESRPCHVAMCGGFYEDASAVTKGWKENPVEFDSVFNESTHSWAIGAPDVVQLFRGPRVTVLAYPPNYIDFAKDALIQDTWVRDTLQRDVFGGSTYSALLDQPRNVFFLHFLATDTIGHAFKPRSPQYQGHVSVLDHIVFDVYSLFERVFNDSSTAYLFTADHGMSDKGSHGDGEPANTRTPYVTWGAGVRHPIPPDAPDCKHVADSPASWHVDHLCRHDVQQADLAALMASLSGIPFPMNGVGVVPVGILSIDEGRKTEALLNNARQMFAQYTKKHDEKELLTTFFFEYPRLTVEEGSRELEAIASLAHARDYAEAQRRSQKLIETALDGLDYFQTYDKGLLQAVVVCGYAGWLLFLATFVTQRYCDTSRVESGRLAQVGLDDAADAVPSLTPVFHRPHNGVLVAFGVFCLFLFLQHGGPMYYVYAAFPAYFLSYVLCNWHYFPIRPRVFLSLAKRSTLFPQYPTAVGSESRPVALTAVLTIVSCFCSAELLVFSYYERRVLTCILGCIAAWPWASHLWQRALSRDAAPTLVLSSCTMAVEWTVACVACAVFPMLPLSLEENIPLIGAGVVGLFTFAYFSIRQFSCLPGRNVYQTLFSTAGAAARAAASPAFARSIIHLAFQMLLVLLAFWTTVHTSSHIASRTGLPLINQCLAWGVLALAIVGPKIASTHYFDLMCRLVLNFAPSFILLSLSYEVVFYCALSLLLLLWVVVECRVRHRVVATYRDAPTTTVGGSGSGQSPTGTNVQATTDVPAFLSLSDARTALFYLSFCYLAFFGTGNIASITSFELASTYRFVTVFSPFSMTGILLYKVMVPLILVACAFGIICRVANIPVNGAFFIVIGISDILTLNFFFMVRNRGSWQDIGMSIGHYCISNMFIIFQLLLLAISQGLVTRHLAVTHPKRR
eukprot:TRINITY_DN5080_c0_g1_i1.p1 TRINITY_DN5080_c0_g1~~TRINITY_DN5080_c0_g1_i1.p1  ORF type:complete len:1020 (+),score=190.71 TRINITY_DN5080_c0_g1_i1:334-3060(+)